MVSAGAQVTRGTAQREANGALFVAHLVGDIDQPLHAGFAEDRGGNSVDVSFKGRKMNLPLAVGYWPSRARGRHADRDSRTAMAARHCDRLGT
jgi:hypothetical protein